MDCRRARGEPVPIWEAIVLAQDRGDGGLEQGGGRRVSEKQLGGAGGCCSTGGRVNRMCW